MLGSMHCSPSSNGMSGGAFGGFFNSIGSLIGLKDGGQIPGYDSGGRIRGPGGPRDDKVLLWGSNGEFMMNAAATQKWLPVLEAMNAGKLPQLRDGGGVGFSAPRIASASIPVPSIPSVAQLSGTSSVDNSRTDNSVSGPTINVTVNGATGNAEVAAMVQEGLAKGMMAWQRSPHFANAVSQGVKQANSAECCGAELNKDGLRAVLFFGDMDEYLFCYASAGAGWRYLRTAGRSKDADRRVLVT